MGVKEMGEVAAPKCHRNTNAFGSLGKNSRMVSLLTSHFSHFSKRVVSMPDCFGWSLLIAWESLDPSLGVGMGGGVGAMAGGELTSEL